MGTPVLPRRVTPAVAVQDLLNPLPAGCFVAAWIFDIVYIKSLSPFWTQAASWLIVIGLLIAILPRRINLVQVWIGHSYPQTSPVKIDFWANALAIVLAIFNAFVHSRDAYAVAPAGVILSTLVVAFVGDSETATHFAYQAPLFRGRLSASMEAGIASR